MKKAQRQRIETFILQAKPLLELNDWRFILLDDPCEDGAYAEVFPTEGQKLALLKVCPEFFQLDDRNRRRVLIHEMCHCLTHDTSYMVKSTLPELLGQPTFNAFWEPYRLATEVLVDTLAQCLADIIPLEV